MLDSRHGGILTEWSIINVILNFFLDNRSGDTQQSPGKISYNALRRLSIYFHVPQYSKRAFFRHIRQLDPRWRIREAGGGIGRRTF
ncbi:hypothetical protein AURDEDRAFT_171609 [Auricularia subglabra TFB-10046 SS5]|nr:hypothetical protein AURDEDRAFT_171609 [Auricularia subglabra TFB-10046 SS5]